jgi:hypothetical protein
VYGHNATILPQNPFDEQKMKRLYISHSIFLTRQEIADLASPTTIETVGFCVPVDESASDLQLSEIYCPYSITSHSTDEIEEVEAGYHINISDTNKWVKAADAPDDITWFQFVIENVTTKNGERFFTTNQIVIQDISELERSVFCENLASYLNRTTR